MLGLDVLVNIANVVYLFSYSVRDILWLRVLTVVGTLMLLPYYYYQSQPLWTPIGWQSVFILINIFWITLLLLDRRPVPFTKEERKLYQLAFSHMLRMANWVSVPASTALMTQGQPVASLSLIAEGDVRVDLNGAAVDTLGAGRLLGGTAFLSQGAHFEAPVTVTTTAPCRLVVWSFNELQPQLEKDTGLQLGIEAAIGLEISRFLKTARAHLLRPGL